MLDPRTPSDTHDWGPAGELSLARARVIGGCSAHNACFVSWGSRGDYDAWGADAPGWSFREIEPYRRRAQDALRPRTMPEADRHEWSLGVIDAAAEAGIPTLADFNDLSAPEGAGILPMNVASSVRWNTAFAYLDAARGRRNLTVLDRALAERVLLERGRAVGAAAIVAGEPTELAGDVVVASAGAYGSPLVLLRSGIGPADHLDQHGIDLAVDLPGVGANLQDHFGVNVVFRPTPRLVEALAVRLAEGRLFGGGAIVRAGSRRCPADTWDLHLVCWAWTDAEGITGTDFRVQLSPYVMAPASRGRVRLRTRDPDEHPDVELGYLSDPEGADLGVLADGVGLVRRIAAQASLVELISEEAVPGPAVSRTEDFLAENVRGYFHPVGTCRMGGTDDADAVVDPSGRVRGVDGLYVCDASVIPTIPRANTNLTTIAIAERIAEEIAKEDE
jgi:choline dehydrogenase